MNTERHDGSNDGEPFWTSGVIREATPKVEEAPPQLQVDDADPKAPDELPQAPVVVTAPEFTSHPVLDRIIEALAEGEDAFWEAVAAEGLAVAVERPWGFEDRSRLAWELVAGPRLTLREIDALFDGGQSAQSRAYSLSAAVVRDLIREHGAAAPAGILRLVKTDVGFDQAVAQVTGRPIGAVDDEFWDRQRVWTVWMPAITSGNVLWLIVIAVATLAVWRRRRRSAQTRRRWEEEERAAAERDGAPPGRAESN